MSYYINSAGNRVYEKVFKTQRMKRIIEYAVSNGSSMTARTASIYDRVPNMATIKRMIDRDILTLRAIAEVKRTAIPRKLAEESVRRYRAKRN